MRSLVVYLLAAAALAVGAWFAFPALFGRGAESSAAAQTPAAPPPVVVAVAARAPFADSIEALGTVLANESIVITPNDADHVTALHFTDGQMVEAGQLLVEMSADRERALLAESMAVRDERKANYERAMQLYERDMLSDRERDATMTLVAAAEARVASLQAEIADREIRAPFAGVLGLRRVSVGAFVDPQTIITTLDDLSTVKLDFTIPETWLASVRPGMAVQATSDAWPGQAFTGEVANVDTRLDPRSRSATVRATLPNDEHALRPGMLLKVKVERGEAPVLQIPEEALIPMGEQQFVLKVDAGGIAQRVEVTIGRRRPGTVEVKGGLVEGDQVVVEGSTRARAGSAVRVVSTRGAER